MAKPLTDYTERLRNENLVDVSWQIIMRILCLHGVGGNAKMFEAQLLQITSVLKKVGHEFEYVDGIMDCDPPDGTLSLPTTQILPQYLTPPQ
jgi:hypothetical protein